LQLNQQKILRESVMADLKNLYQAVLDGDQASAATLTKQALDDGVSPDMILNQGLISAMDTVGDLFSKNEIYIPEMLIAARAMKSAMEILEPQLLKAGVEPVGKFVIGTVSGDLHDIGKNLVAMMMKGAGFDVIDLGVDVPKEKFIEQAKKTKPHLIGLSTLLTTSMPSMEEIVQAVKDAGLAVKVMVGGAPVTDGFAKKIGADGYAPDAAAAVIVAKSLIS
jgi:5-methyltetrahydrofolate--homocysteine methyltransferase